MLPSRSWCHDVSAAPVPSAQSASVVFQEEALKGLGVPGGVGGQGGGTVSVGRSLG